MLGDLVDATPLIASDLPRFFYSNLILQGPQRTLMELQGQSQGRESIAPTSRSKSIALLSVSYALISISQEASSLVQALFCTCWVSLLPENFPRAQNKPPVIAFK